MSNHFFMQFPCAESLDNFTDLDFGWVFLTVLPEGIFRYFPSLVNLNLAKNQLHSFPKNFFQDLPKLQYLRLTDNKIREIPDKIKSLTELKKLDMMRNPFFILPESISNLENLETLNFIGTKIKQENPSLLPFRNRKVDVYLA